MNPMRKLLLTLAGVVGVGLFSSLGCKDYYRQQVTAESLPGDELSFKYGKQMRASGNKIDFLGEEGRNYTNYTLERSLEKSSFAYNADTVRIYRGRKTISYYDKDADGSVDSIKISENNNSQEYDRVTPGAETLFVAADKYLAETKTRFNDWVSKVSIQAGLIEK